MTTIDRDTETLVAEWLTLNEAADRLRTSESRVKQLLRDHKLIGAQRAEGGIAIPAAFIAGEQVVKGLHGTLTLLADCGFTDEESLRWLFTTDDTLPGKPIEAICANRGTEVRRRAQALAI